MDFQTAIERAQQIATEDNSTEIVIDLWSPEAPPPHKTGPFGILPEGSDLWLWKGDGVKTAFRVTALGVTEFSL